MSQDKKEEVLFGNVMKVSEAQADLDLSPRRRALPIVDGEVVPPSRSIFDGLPEPERSKAVQDFISSQSLESRSGMQPSADGPVDLDALDPWSPALTVAQRAAVLERARTDSEYFFTKVVRLSPHVDPIYTHPKRLSAGPYLGTYIDTCDPELREKLDMWYGPNHEWDRFRQALGELMYTAGLLDIRVTIENVHKAPLAMGHYDQVVSVRPKLSVWRPKDEARREAAKLAEAGKTEPIQLVALYVDNWKKEAYEVFGEGFDPSLWKFKNVKIEKDGKELATVTLAEGPSYEDHVHCLIMKSASTREIFGTFEVNKTTGMVELTVSDRRIAELKGAIWTVQYKRI